MGSTGWVRCYWCEQWVNNAYIPDPIAKPLCSPCLDHYAEGHQVWRPNAVDHRTNSLWLVIPFMRDIPLALVWEIATYIEDPYRPGRGSRWNPVPQRARPVVWRQTWWWGGKQGQRRLHIAG